MVVRRGWFMRDGTGAVPYNDHDNVGTGLRACPRQVESVASMVPPADHA